MSQNAAATKAWGGENGAFPFWLSPKSATQQEEFFWFCRVTLNEEHLLGQAKQGLNCKKKYWSMHFVWTVS